MFFWRYVSYFLCFPDKDECALGHHTCNAAQECVNTMGGYQCVNSCPTGFEPATNGSCIGELDGFTMEDWGISIANALEIPQSCNMPLM